MFSATASPFAKVHSIVRSHCDWWYIIVNHHDRSLEALSTSSSSGLSMTPSPGDTKTAMPVLVAVFLITHSFHGAILSPRFKAISKIISCQVKKSTTIFRCDAMKPVKVCSQYWTVCGWPLHCYLILKLGGNGNLFSDYEAASFQHALKL